jgi:hypothetical protein
MKSDANQSPREAAGGWQAVPPGTLNQLQGELRARHRREQVGEQVRRWASGAALVLVAGLFLGGIAWQVSQSNSADAHALSCPECRDLLDGYARHSLTPELELQVHVHLDKCESCRTQLARVQQQLGETLPGPTPAGPEQVAKATPARPAIPWAESRSLLTSR